MISQIRFRDALHSINLNLNVAPVGQWIWNSIKGLLVDLKKDKNEREKAHSNLVKLQPSYYLHAMNGKAGTSVELFVTNMTFEMLRFLMLQQYLLIIKVPITIPAPGLRRLLLFTAHHQKVETIQSISKQPTQTIEKSSHANDGRPDYWAQPTPHFIASLNTPISLFLYFFFYRT